MDDDTPNFVSYAPCGARASAAEYEPMMQPTLRSALTNSEGRLLTAEC